MKEPFLGSKGLSVTGKNQFVFGECLFDKIDEFTLEEL